MDQWSDQDRPSWLQWLRLPEGEESIDEHVICREQQIRQSWEYIPHIESNVRLVSPCTRVTH